MCCKFCDEIFDGMNSSVGGCSFLFWWWAKQKFCVMSAVSKKLRPLIKRSTCRFEHDRKFFQVAEIFRETKTE